MPNIKTIFPIIKLQRPNEEPARELPPGTTPIIHDLAGDLLVAYGFELEQSYQLVSVDDCTALDLTERELRRQAILNLHHKVISSETGGVKSVARGATRMYRLDGNLETSLLLLSWLWDQGEWDFQGLPVVAAPCRDVLVASGTDQPNGVEELREVVGRLFEPGSKREHLLSRLLYVRCEKRWGVYGG